MLSFFESYGLDTGARLKRLLESLLRQRGLPTDLTYKQLRELKTGLACSPHLRGGCVRREAEGVQ
jgi:antitoxin component of RelBE/YafQ-DinJ toxin-antitoxin module